MYSLCMTLNEWNKEGCFDPKLKKYLKNKNKLKKIIFKTTESGSLFHVYNLISRLKNHI